MDSCIPQYCVVHEMTARVACVKQQSLRSFKIKGKKQSSLLLSPVSIGLGDSARPEIRKIMQKTSGYFLARNIFLQVHDVIFKHLLEPNWGEYWSTGSLHVAKAHSTVTAVEGSLVNENLWIQVLRSPNNPQVAGSCSLASPQKSRVESITKTYYCYFHFCLYPNIQLSSRCGCTTLA